MRRLVKSSNSKASLTARSGVNNAIRRTIDVFVIEGKNLLIPGSVNKLFNHQF